MENQDYEKIIRKLKRKLLFWRIIVIGFVLILIAGAIFIYYYSKPYIEKFNELVINFQSIQTSLNQISNITSIDQLLGSNKNIQTAINTLNSLSKDIKAIESTVNAIKSDFQWVFNLLTN